jgi:hypothetical protein
MASRSSSRARLCALAGAALLVALGCRRRETGPTPEEQGYLPTDFRAHAEYVTHGVVDWGNHRYLCRVSVPVVEKTTAGIPVARLVAETQAYDAAGAVAARVALNLASGIRVDSHDVLSDLAQDEGTLRTWGHVSGRTLVKKRVALNGDMEFVFQIPMVGVNGVVSNLYSRAAGRAAGDRGAYGASVACVDAPADSVAWGAEASCSLASLASRQFAAAGGEAWDVDWSLVQPKYELSESTRGDAAPVIIIDARGTGLVPALFPVVRDETGRVVYNAAKADRDAVVSGGLVQYVEMVGGGVGSAAAFTRHSFLADGGGMRRRVVVVAQAADGALMADIVVSNADAARIAAEASAVREARVTVVVDASGG